MQRTFFIFFLLLTIVNISFWTIQSQNEAGFCKLQTTSKETIQQHAASANNGEELNTPDARSFPFQKNSTVSKAPFENGDEDKFEVEKESLVAILLCFPEKTIINNPLAGNIVSSYDRYFFKIHFLDIFSPPPNC